MKSEIKAKAVKEFCDKNKIEYDIITTDDAGLCVNCLNGEPGVYSARYASEHASQEEVRNSATLAQNADYFIFFFPPAIFPQTSDHPASLYHKYPKSLNLGEVDLRLVFLAWLPCKGKPQHLSIWLPAHWAMEPGTLTLIPTFHRVSVKIKD